METVPRLTPETPPGLVARLEVDGKSFDLFARPDAARGATESLDQFALGCYRFDRSAWTEQDASRTIREVSVQ